MNAAIEGEQGFAEIEFAMSRTPKKNLFSFIFYSLFLFLNVFYFSLRDILQND